MTNKQRKTQQRTLSATEGGSYKGDVINNGQWRHANVYCPVCHVFNRIPHKSGCKGKKVRISPNARIPRNNASKKLWDRFYEKFVNCHHSKKYGWLEWKKDE